MAGAAVQLPLAAPARVPSVVPHQRPRAACAPPFPHHGGAPNPQVVLIRGYPPRAPRTSRPCPYPAQTRRLRLAPRVSPGRRESARVTAQSPAHLPCETLVGGCDCAGTGEAVMTGQIMPRAVRRLHCPEWVMTC